MIVVFVAIHPITAKATHLRAADIQVERICGTLSFRITVIAYLNSQSGTRFGTNSEVFFGDFTSQRIPITNSTPRPDLGDNVSIASFSIVHTYASAGVYTITYIERDRSSGVLNIADSHDVPYVTQVEIVADASDCNRYPVLSVVPLDRGCTKTIFYHNPGAFDLDGDSLSYEMTIPKSDVGTFAIYRDPNDPAFYPDFASGNEEGNAEPLFSIDSLTGQLTWDAPGATGEYNIAFKVVEWRKMQDGTYTVLSTTIRDMQIVIEACDNTRPNLLVPADICVTAGEDVTALIRGTDTEHGPVRIEVFSEILLTRPGSHQAVYSPDPPQFMPSEPPAELSFSWTTTCADIRQQPYQVVFKITDEPESGPRLVTFGTWNIRVVAPPPVIEDATLDVVRSQAVLEWDAYACGTVSAVQVWRKVGSFPGTQAECEVGMIRNSGYNLVATVSPADTGWIDSNGGAGLSPGAMYCYRLVALTNGTRSRVSSELCIGPVKRDAPVITHVSVISTGKPGAVRISWRSPTDINKEQFPPPYEYAVYRAADFAGDQRMTPAGGTSDTTLVDEGLNTSDSVWNYRVVVYARPEFSDKFIPVDTSAAASTVRLSAAAGDDFIRLHWRDSVPWSNVSQSRPYHVIYRGEGLLPDDALMLLDSVNVLDSGFHYTDRTVARDVLYTYKVMTRGTYGNPDIAVQQNLSQTISIYPINDLVACAPLLTAENPGCDNLMASEKCLPEFFENAITWQPDNSEGCRIDIVAYKLYASDGRDTVYTLLTQTQLTSYVHSELQTPIRCYRISTIDLQGNEGPASEPVCTDSCPYFELPNVFTPNNDGCNDLFTSRFNAPDATQIPCPYQSADRCPRFVKSVSLQIYNRWGGEVYRFASSDPALTTIDWNGIDNEGGMVASGIYYYVAEVEFDVLDPDRRKVIYKDWVHLTR